MPINKFPYTISFRRFILIYTYFDNKKNPRFLLPYKLKLPFIFISPNN